MTPQFTAELSSVARQLAFLALAIAVLGLPAWRGRRRSRKATAGRRPRT